MAFALRVLRANAARAAAAVGEGARSRRKRKKQRQRLSHSRNRAMSQDNGDTSFMSFGGANCLRRDKSETED